MLLDVMPVVRGSMLLHYTPNFVAVLPPPITDGMLLVVAVYGFDNFGIHIFTFLSVPFDMFIIAHPLYIVNTFL